ncbi:MAG: hypothetical protein AAGJ97_14865, partial [Planctomycetota bacterium]
AAWIAGEEPTELYLVAAGCVAAAVFFVGRAAGGPRRSAVAATLAVATFLLVEYRQLFGGGALFEWCQSVLIRPQMAGLVAYASLMPLVFTGTPARSMPLLVAPTFVLWANLHGSWPMGLFVLAAAGLGAGFDTAWRAGSPAAAWRSRRARRLLLSTAVAASAVFMNPYGPGLIANVFGFSSDQNLYSLVEWRPISLEQRQGVAALCVAVMWLLTLAASRRRKSAFEVLAVVVLGLLTLKASRFVVWWGPIVAVSFARHADAVVRQHFASAVRGQRPIAATRLLFAAGVAAAAIGGTDRLLTRPTEDGDVASSFAGSVDRLPAGVLSAWLPEYDDGLVWTPYEWGDAFLWARPGCPVFVASHVHLIPADVWRDYRTVSLVRDGWEDVLRRRGVTTVVADRGKNRRLIALLRKRESRWAE